MSATNPFSPEALAIKVLEKLGASPPTAETVLRRAAELAVLVNKAPGLSGAEKLALVQRVLRDIVNMPDMLVKGLGDKAVAELNNVIDTIVPTTISLIVSAGRGEFDLKKVVPTVVAAWSPWCCRAISTVVDVTASSLADPQKDVELPAVSVEVPDANNVPKESVDPTPAP